MLRKSPGAGGDYSALCSHLRTPFANKIGGKAIFCPLIPRKCQHVLEVPFVFWRQPSELLAGNTAVISVSNTGIKEDRRLSLVGIVSTLPDHHGLSGTGIFPARAALYSIVSHPSSGGGHVLGNSHACVLDSARKFRISFILDISDSSVTSTRSMFRI